MSVVFRDNGAAGRIAEWFLIRRRVCFRKKRTVTRRKLLRLVLNKDSALWIGFLFVKVRPYVEKTGLNVKYFAYRAVRIERGLLMMIRIDSGFWYGLYYDGVSQLLCLCFAVVKHWFPIFFLAGLYCV